MCIVNRIKGKCKILMYYLFLSCFDDFRRWRIFYNTWYDGIEFGRSCILSSRRWRRGVR